MAQTSCALHPCHEIANLFKQLRVQCEYAVKAILAVDVAMMLTLSKLQLATRYSLLCPFS